MEPIDDIAQSVYSDADYDRLGTMKKAADVVFEYLRWAMEDHRRLMHDKDHQNRIKTLVHDVMAVFGLTDQDEMLARYFIANVLHTAQEVEFSAMARDAWKPFSETAIAEIYSVEEVASMLADLAPHKRCMYSGRFMADVTDSNQWLESITAGMIVGCDSDLVMTGSWEILLEAFDIEDDTTFVCVGKAAMRAREETQQTLDEFIKRMA